jgi:hypothetical protein
MEYYQIWRKPIGSGQRKYVLVTIQVFPGYDLAVKYCDDNDISLDAVDIIQLED